MRFIDLLTRNKDEKREYETIKNNMSTGDYLSLCYQSLSLYFIYNDKNEIRIIRVIHYLYLELASVARTTPDYYIIRTEDYIITKWLMAKIR